MKLLSYTNIKNLANRPVLFSCTIISFLSLIAIFSFGITFYITSRGVDDLVTQEHNRNNELINSNNLARQKFILDPKIDANAKEVIHTNNEEIIITENRDSILNSSNSNQVKKDNKSTPAKNDSISKKSNIIENIDSTKSAEVIRLVNKPIYDEILNTQAKLNSEQIIYSIKQSYYHLSFYNGLIAVIIVFTTLMSISIFMISHKGWNGSSVYVKVFGLTVIILLGLANLINTVVKPKENFNTYVQGVKKSSANQIKIFDMINDYNRIPAEKMDSVVSKNFEDLNYNVELLPNIDEEKLSSSSIDVTDVTGI